MNFFWVLTWFQHLYIVVLVVYNFSNDRNNLYICLRVFGVIASGFQGPRIIWLSLDIGYNAAITYSIPICREIEAAKFLWARKNSAVGSIYVIKLTIFVVNIDNRPNWINIASDLIKIYLDSLIITWTSTVSVVPAVNYAVIFWTELVEKNLVNQLPISI